MSAPALHLPIPQMSMGEQLVAAEMHVRNMWEPTGWDSPETAFDLDQDDVDTVIASLAPQGMVKVKVEKEEAIVVRAEKSIECTHVSNPSLPPSPPTCTDDVSEAVHMLSEKTTWSSSTVSFTSSSSPVITLSALDSRWVQPNQRPRSPVRPSPDGRVTTAALSPPHLGALPP